MEASCLQRLREKNHIICRDHKSQIELQRSNKRKKDRGVEEVLEHHEKKRKQAIREDLLNFDSGDEDYFPDDEFYADEATSSKY